VIRTAAKARRQTHLHLGIHATGEFGVGMKVVDAAAHLEEIERIVHKLFRGYPRSKRSVVKVIPWKLFARDSSQPRRDRRAWEFVFQMHLDERSKAQPQAIRVGLGKSDAQHLIEDEARFEVRSGWRVFDRVHAIAQVEAPGSPFRGGKQPLKPPPQVGGLTDIRLCVWILSAQKKYGWGGRYSGEDLRVSFRMELDAFG